MVPSRFSVFLYLLLISLARSKVRVELTVQPMLLPRFLNNTMEFSLSCAVKEETYQYRRYNRGPSCIVTRMRILQESRDNNWQPLVQLSNMEPNRVFVDPAFPNVKAEGSISQNLLSRDSTLSARWTGSTLEAVKRFRCDAVTFENDYSNSGSYRWGDTKIMTTDLNSHSLAQLYSLEKQSTLKKIGTLSVQMSGEKPTESQHNAVTKEREEISEMLRRIKTRLAEIREEQAMKIEKMTQLLNDILVNALENQTRTISNVESTFDVALEGSFLMMWPRGIYALQKPDIGCPSTDGEDWKEGYRRHHTESVQRNEDYVSAGNHLQQPVLPRKGKKFMVNQVFCAKTEENTFGPSWPKGSYCIGALPMTCPAGFQMGEITWDEEDFRSGAEFGGQLPMGKYEESKTMIKYCCRKDGGADEPIDLPRFQPFYLYRYGGKCQQVRAMNVAEEYIRFDTENSNNADKATGHHPDVELNNLVLHLCYYEQAA